MNRKFLYGIIVGMGIMFVLLSSLSLYEDLNRRLGHVEGYIQQLDQMIRGQQSHVVRSSDSRAAD